MFTLTVMVLDPLMLPVWVTAVTVATVLAVTVGALKFPAALMAPMEVLQFTAVVGEPLAKALHWLVWRDCTTVGEQLTVIADRGVTVTVAVAFMVESCTEVAVMLTEVLVVTDCAVKTPLASMTPALDPQYTAVLKLVPVPVTVAVQALVWPVCNEVGVQVTDTPVMAVLLELPQAAIPISDKHPRIRARTRKPSPRNSETRLPL